MTTDEAGETTVCRGALGAGRIASHPAAPPSRAHPRHRSAARVSDPAATADRRSPHWLAISLLGRPQELDYRRNA